MSDDMDFKIWKRNLNLICEKKLCVSLDDLPDANYYDYFEEGLTPEEAWDTLKEDNAFDMTEEEREHLM